ncbi:glycosyltransferase family 4 protein [Chryseobacterium sp. SC28]|uniref:glycosyltransferase family 4 protein n=1 Tax=Chryseobacterium sp. SC28 TaxID=2268028 RepID=UPI000F652E44|nr:glycosyltransferase family 4 protein [Chryseobacterium sp. SC28]RRQ45852.1 glycosyltransferase family 4 protein [Chryseobacterium sp. SC28]
MKILYCIASYSAKGGTEKVLSSKASYLAENGHQVTILISDQHQKPLAYPLSDQIELIDLQITKKMRGKIKVIGFVQNVIFLRKLYRREIKKIDPDVIIVLERGYEDFILPYILKEIPKIREYHFSRKASAYLESQLAPFEKYKKKIIRKIYEHLYKKYDRLVLLTKKDQQSWAAYSNTVVIPNVVEPSVTLANQPILTRPKNIIAVGSMADDRKGFSALIDIWSRLENKFPEWSLNIYGDGPYKTNYEKKIRDLNLNNVHLKGISEHIAEKYAESQLFVMTSKGEGLPMVMIEALSQGLPAVVYDCYCGPSDIIAGNKGGFLIEFGNENQFVEQLELLMRNEALREAKSKETAAVASQYALKEMMPRWINLFKELVR